MAPAEKKRLSTFRFVALALVLTVLVFAVIGAFITLFPTIDNAPVPETRKSAPQVRQLDREALRQHGHKTGS
jgi:hypothetical protein